MGCSPVGGVALPLLMESDCATEPLRVDATVAPLVAHVGVTNAGYCHTDGDLIPIQEKQKTKMLNSEEIDFEKRTTLSRECIPNVDY